MPPPDFIDQPHDERDPSPWRALYLDQSTPLPDDVKAAWLRDCSSGSRQYLLPFLRPLARTSIVLIQILKVLLALLAWSAPLAVSLPWARAASRMRASSRAGRGMSPLATFISRQCSISVDSPCSTRRWPARRVDRGTSGCLLLSMTRCSGEARILAA